MKNRKLVLFITIFVTLMCLFRLSFSYHGAQVHQKALDIAKNSEGVIDLDKKQQVLKDFWNQEVYNFFGKKYTYAEVKEREIILGLDLQGGMYVTLEIAPVGMLRELSKNIEDIDFINFIDEIEKKSILYSPEELIDNFVSEFEKKLKDKKLAEYLPVLVKKGKIKAISSNKEVATILKKEFSDAVDRSFDVISNRIDKFGTMQPNIQHVKGTNKIQIELPGATNPERVRKLLQGVAELNFWEVCSNQEVLSIFESLDKKLISDGFYDESIDNKKTSFIFSRMVGSPMTYKKEDVQKINDILQLENIANLIPRGVKWLWDAKPKKNQLSGDEYFTLYAIKTSGNGGSILSGDSISNAYISADEQGSPVVAITMNSNGAQIWKRATGRNIGKRIAITLDNLVFSAPVVNSEIPNGVSIISGNFSIEEAQDLVNVLKAGSLPIPVKIVEEAVIGPSLGEESQKQGIKSTIIGFLVVIIFMMLYYAQGGFIANVCLIFNILFLIGILSQLGTSLTMSGIAGIVLTMGMAVDSNVLIFERIRDELKSGKNLRQAISLGYDKAFSSIFDSNITTFFSGVIMYILGQGVIKGFATTLMLGIVTSFFTSVYISRLILSYFVENKKSSNFKFYFSWTNNIFARLQIDFIKLRKKSYVFSSFIFILGVAAFITKKEVNLGVDFTGGRSYVINFGTPIQPEMIKSILGNAFDGSSVESKTYGSNNAVKITTSFMLNEDEALAAPKVRKILINAIKESLGLYYVDQNSIPVKSDEFTISNASKVGSSVARDVKKSAVWSILGALFMIFAYIFIRFRRANFGFAAVIALIHDVIMVLSMFMIISSLGFSLEIDQVFVASILTIIGYSINDTVVIFDRVRENLGLEQPLEKIINSSLNTTLSRTVITSLTTLLAVLSLVVFGGESLRSFSLSVMFGIIFGTYSSIFIAMPLVYDFSLFKKRLDEKKNIS